MQLDLMFHKLARKNLLFMCAKPPLESICLSGKFLKNDGELLRFFATESVREITKRIPYSEKEIIKNAHFDCKNAFIQRNHQYSFIEHLVSLNKALLFQIFSEMRGKFYFTKLELNGFIKEFQTIKLCFESHFNFQLMKTCVFVDTSRVGQIYFSCKD